MYEAIMKYKKAVHLVPDIEKRAFDFTQNRTPSKKEKTPEMSNARGTTFLTCMRLSVHKIVG